MCSIQKTGGRADELSARARHEFTVRLWDEAGRLVATSTQLQFIKLVRKEPVSKL
jgi:hypothetical protein